MKRPTSLKPINGQKQRIRAPFEDLRVETVIEGESMTDDSAGNDTDVNNIIARFDRTGQLPTGRGPGEFADVSGLNADLTELISMQKEALRELQDLEEQIKDNKEKAEELKDQVQEQPQASGSPPMVQGGEAGEANP